MTRSSFTWVLSGMSPISSSSSVPPWAISSRPGLADTALVKAPFSWPNSSLSSSVSVSAAQLISTNGPAARGEARWMARANTSLPTPVSPRSSTQMSETAICSTSR